MPNTSRLVTTNVLYTEISEDLDKIPEMSNLVTTNNLNEKVDEVNQNLRIKIGFDNKLTSYNRQIT